MLDTGLGPDKGKRKRKRAQYTTVSGIKEEGHAWLTDILAGY